VIEVKAWTLVYAAWAIEGLVIRGLRVVRSQASKVPS
jgi:hypothetical protein